MAIADPQKSVQALRSEAMLGDVDIEKAGLQGS